MRFFFLLVPVLHVAARITLFDEDQSTTSVPTFDFFEHRSNPYNITGIACRISLAKDPETQLCKVVAPPTLENNNFTQPFQQTIMYAKFHEAYECNIRTISQLFEKAYEMPPFLKQAGYPPSKTLVVFTGQLYDGDVGCPIAEPYISRRIYISDSPPSSSINVALVGGEHAMKFLGALDETRPYIFNVVQETDPWNGMFLSFGYIFFKWCSVAIYAVSIATALKKTFEVHGKGTIAMNLQNMIFWMMISAAIGNLYSNSF